MSLITFICLLSFQMKKSRSYLYAGLTEVSINWVQHRKQSQKLQSSMWGAQTWKWRMMVQMRPNVSLGFPSVMSSFLMFTSLTWKQENRKCWFSEKNWEDPSKSFAQKVVLTTVSNAPDWTNEKKNTHNLSSFLHVKDEKWSLLQISCSLCGKDLVKSCGSG